MSVAVRVGSSGTSSHSTVVLPGNASTNEGSVVSVIVKVAEVVVLLLHSSVTVKITVTAPDAPHPSLKPLVVAS